VFPAGGLTLKPEVSDPKLGSKLGSRLDNLRAVLYSSYELERNLKVWEDGELTACERRIFIVNWVASAWGALKANAEFIRSSFVSTGWLLAKDGSENWMVSLKKWDSAYGFPKPEPVVPVVPVVAVE
jgi:hypothetical protein